MHPLSVKYKAIVHYTHFYNSLRGVARIYNVSKSTVSRWISSVDMRRHRQPQSRLPRIEERVYAAIRELVKTNPAVNMHAIKQHLSQSHAFSKSMSSIQRAVRRAGITRKRMSQIAEHNPLHADMYASQRELFNTRLNDIVSIDETCFYSTDCSRYGYSMIGTRARLCVHKKRMARTKVNLLLATTPDHVLGFKVYVGSCNSQSFAEFVRSLPLSQGAILLMDNVAFHKSRVVKQAADDKCASIFFTPPYSPWYNPVETTFSVIKQRYRKELQSCQVTITPNCITRIITQVLQACPTQCSFIHVRKLLNMDPSQAMMS